MFLDLFCLLGMALKPRTPKKEQALISKRFLGKCRYGMENDLYSLQVFSLLSPGFEVHNFSLDFLWHHLLALSSGIH